MGLMRSGLLWASRNKWMRDHVPSFPFVRRAVTRFMPGEDTESALQAAATFQQQGMGVILISSELPELLGMCDRILVMSKGTITGKFSREEADQEKIMASAVVNVK